MKSNGNRASALLRFTRLPETQRRVIKLHHRRGLTFAEVAKKLNRTKDAVAGLIYRGLQKLRVLLQELIMVEA